MVPSLTLEAPALTPSSAHQSPRVPQGLRCVCGGGGILQANQLASERRGASTLYGAELEQHTV